MAEDSVPEHIIDVARHGGTENLVGPIPQPTIGGNFILDENVIKGEQNISGRGNRDRATSVQSMLAASHVFLDVLTRDHWSL